METLSNSQRRHITIVERGTHDDGSEQYTVWDTEFAAGTSVDDSFQQLWLSQAAPAIKKLHNGNLNYFCKVAQLLLRTDMQRNTIKENEIPWATDALNVYAMVNNSQNWCRTHRRPYSPSKALNFLCYHRSNGFST
jgi:hypothetical protein